MNFKSVASIALFAVTGSIGALLPVLTVHAETEQPVSQQIVRYECYNRDGSLAFVTTDPYETIGWKIGCREVSILSAEAAEPRIPYYQCYDDNGNIAFSTTSSWLADQESANCRQISYRNAIPVQSRPIYYECLNSKGEVAFTTTRFQDTQGWVPNCREIRTLDPASLIPQGL